jgi:hypothetical protein
MANRQGRIKALIAKDISDILTFELKNPHIGMVSVNEVEVSLTPNLEKVGARGHPRLLFFVGIPRVYLGLYPWPHRRKGPG